MARASTTAWRIRRLLAMSPSEVTLRALRKAAGLLRRNESSKGLARMSTPEAFLVDAIDADEVDGWLRKELSMGRCRLLPGADDSDRLGRELADLGVMSESIIAAAEEVLSGMVPAFGWTKIDTGPDPDWLADPVSGGRWPLSYWSELDYRRSETLGDPRYVWEVNRHHHLITLARAYALTGDSRYADRVWRDISSWISANPPLSGINWASPLEVAIRLISWSMAVDIVGSDGAGQGEVGALTASVALQAAHLSGNLSIYASSKNNHLIGEAAGLLVVGAKFPFLRSANALAGRGRSILQREIYAQVTSDGVDREQAFGYQSFVLEFTAAGAAALMCMGAELPPGFRDRVAAMAGFLNAVAGPARGEAPAIGDGDGARAYQLSDREDRRAMQAAVTAAVGCCSALPASHEPPDLEAALWLFGPERVARSLALPGPDIAAGDRGSPSAHFAEGGYFVPAGDDQHGVIDCGPLGYLSIAAHGHADCLSLVVCHRGRWVIVDPGTFCYHREDDWRDYFRSTAAHNTVSVDRGSQSEMLGPFLWGRRAGHRQGVWAPSSRFDLFAGAVGGLASARGVSHERTVVFGKRGYWLIVDRIVGEGRHEIRSALQLAPGLEREEGGGMIFTTGRAGGVEIWSWPPKGFGSEVLRGSMEPRAGWVSQGFGHRTAASAVMTSGTADLPVSLMTAVAPFTGRREISLDCSDRGHCAGAEFIASFSGGQDSLALGTGVTTHDGTVFSGALGFTARRGGRIDRWGVDVEEWVEDGVPVRFTGVPNLLITD